jgi:anti-sigma regulatory factor (Ser/Thr protein kinase)
VSGGSRDLVWGLDREYAQDDHDAPRDARRAIAEQGDLPPGVCEDVMIVVTELLTNAIRHPPRVVGGRIRLTVRREPDAVHVEVRDPGGGFAVPDPAREGGLGLIAVDRISSDWGLTVTDATVVWSTIAISD